MEVSETSDNSGVQKSSEAISESSQEDGSVVVTKEETTKTNEEDGTTTTTVVVKKKVTVKNPDTTKVEEENVEETIKKHVEKENEPEEEIIEYVEGDDDGEDVETVVETVVIKKTSSDNDKDGGKSGETSTTTTKTITKKKLVSKSDSIESEKESPSTTTTVVVKKDDEDEKKKSDSPEKKKVEEKQEKAVKDIKKEEESEPAVKEIETAKKEEITKETIKEEPEEEEKQQAEVEKQKEVVEEEEEEEEEEEIEEVEEEEEEEEEIIEEPIKKIIEEKPPVTVTASTTKPIVEEEEKSEISEKVTISKPPLPKQQSSEQMQRQQQSQLQQQQPITKDEDIPPPSSVRQEPPLQQQQQQQQYQPTQQPQPQLPSSNNRQVSNLTTREETKEDGFIKKSETIERNEIQDHGDGRTEVRSHETKTTIQSTHPPSVTFYNSNLPYQQLHQQHQQQQQQQQQQHQHIPYGATEPQHQHIPYGPPESNYLLNDSDLKGHRSMSLPTHNQYVSEHQHQTTKRVDLQKIFTPATDADEILPKNRKLYASSAFYSPNLHPTVEDQVELARRISHSLSDISNQQSKGQTMYVNRKKRSVKWVHEGEGCADIPEFNGYHHEDHKENESYSYLDKLPLKLVMNPRGQVRDFSSVRQEYNTESGLLSPDKCAELVAGLNAPKGKGAELFAKRRKKSEKWIVDETNAAQSSPSGVAPYSTSSPNILPAYSDVGRQRVQLNMHQDHLTDLYAQQYGNQRVKMVKTPWEAALETGSAAAAFESDLPTLKQPSSFQPTQNYGGQSLYSGPTGSAADYQSSQSYYETAESTKLPKTSHYQPKTAWQPNSQRDLAYKPSIPQGWNAPPTSLPRELYVPKEIPLDGYNPPSTENYLPSNPMAYQSSGYGSGSGGVGSGIRTGGDNYSNISNNYTSSYSNYGLPQSTSSTGGQSSKITSTNEKSTSFSDYGTSYTTDNTTSHYEITKSFPLTTHSTYESTITQQRSTSGDFGGGSNLGTGGNQSSTLYSTSSTQQSGGGGIGGSSGTGGIQQQYHFPVSNKTSSFYSAPPSYKGLNNWKQTSGVVSHHPSTNFNPSPLPYEKLAKFENPDPDDIQSSYYQRHSIPIRSSSKPRNISSPLPYLSSSAPTPSSIGGGGNLNIGGTCSPINVSSYNQTTTSTHRKLLSPKPNYGGGGGGFSSSGNYNKCKNYNTAARGWGQSNSYKPITFGGSSLAGIAATGGANMPYTDF